MSSEQDAERLVRFLESTAVRGFAVAIARALGFSAFIAIGYVIGYNDAAPAARAAPDFMYWVVFAAASAIVFVVAASNWFWTEEVGTGGRADAR